MNLLLPSLVFLSKYSLSCAMLYSPWPKHLLIPLLSSRLGLHIWWSYWIYLQISAGSSFCAQSSWPEHAGHIGLYQKMLRTYCWSYWKGNLRESICYKDSNGSVALEKMMNTSHFKCPLLQIQYLRAEKYSCLLCTSHPLHQAFISFRHFPI